METPLHKPHLIRAQLGAAALVFDECALAADDSVDKKEFALDKPNNGNDIAKSQRGEAATAISSIIERDMGSSSLGVVSAARSAQATSVNVEKDVRGHGDRVRGVARA